MGKKRLEKRIKKLNIKGAKKIRRLQQLKINNNGSKYRHSIPKSISYC